MTETRRDFFKRSGLCALGMASLGMHMHHFGALSAFAQRNLTEGGSDNDYRALVVLFLLGGNDGNNLIVPVHEDKSLSTYSDYAAARASQGLAIPRAPLLPVTVPRLGHLEYGFHPNLGPMASGINNGIHELYGKGKLALVTNVGSLVRPLTKAQFLDPGQPKPYQLFSHPDQTAQAQTSNGAASMLTGWGGRIADRMTATHNAGGLIPMITSVVGAQLFTNGQNTLPLGIADSGTPLSKVLDPAGFAELNAANKARLAAFNELRRQDLASNYVAAASYTTDLAIEANGALQSFQEVTVEFPDTDIGRQLKQVARLIKKRGDLQVRRQVFFAQIGGYDTHAGQLTQHNLLLGQMSQAIRSFYDEMVVQGVSNDVTTLTLSDFGRTLGPTGQGLTVGSDHAWGNHMLVVGGSVAGGDFYGSLRPDGSGSYFPRLSYNGPDDADIGSSARGRWIPTTSVDQYAVRFARWFGLAKEDEAAIFPNIANFAQHDAANSRLDFLPFQG